MCVDSEVPLLTFHHLWFEQRVPDVQHAFVVVAVAELVFLAPTDETFQQRTCSPTQGSHVFRDESHVL